jgi:transcriptional regulator with XRE-family HTH domain
MKKDQSFDVLFNPHAGDMTTLEVAELLDMHRVTISAWKNGRKRPHFLHRARIEDFLRAVLRAVKNQDLPLSTDLSSAERKVKLRKVLVANGFDK